MDTIKVCRHPETEKHANSDNTDTIGGRVVEAASQESPGHTRHAYAQNSAALRRDTHLCTDLHVSEQMLLMLSQSPNFPVDVTLNENNRWLCCTCMRRVQSSALFCADTRVVKKGLYMGNVIHAAFTAFICSVKCEALKVKSPNLFTFLGQQHTAAFF